MEDFSQFLFYAMDKCGFTYRSLSKKTGIEHQIVYRLLYNNQLPTIEQYVLLLNIIVEHSNFKKNFTNTRMILAIENQLQKENTYKNNLKKQKGKNGNIKRNSRHK